MWNFRRTFAGNRPGEDDRKDDQHAEAGTSLVVTARAGGLAAAGRQEGKRGSKSTQGRQWPHRARVDKPPRTRVGCRVMLQDGTDVAYAFATESPACDTGDQRRAGGGEDHGEYKSGHFAGAVASPCAP